MGATGWSDFVPYDADIPAALQRLRVDVFARGDYLSADGITDEQRKSILKSVRPEMEPWMQKVRMDAELLQEPFRTLYLQGAEKIKGEVMNGDSATRNFEPKPTTIEQLLELRAESGTHSILDILSISLEPQLGAISPFPRTKLVDVFGSEAPTHTDIEQAYDSGSLEKFVSERWRGIYVVAYQNGLPFEIFFAGCSGD